MEKKNTTWSLEQTEDGRLEPIRNICLTCANYREEALIGSCLRNTKGGKVIIHPELLSCERWSYSTGGQDE